MEKVIKGGSLENTVDEIAKEIIKRDNAVSDESIAAVGALQEEVSSVKSAINVLDDEVFNVVTDEYTNEICTIENLIAGDQIGIEAGDSVASIYHTNKNLFQVFDRTAGTLSGYGASNPRAFEESKYYNGMYATGIYSGSGYGAIEYSNDGIITSAGASGGGGGNGTMFPFRLPAGTYTLSLDMHGAFKVSFYDSDNVYLSYLEGLSTTSKTHQTYTFTVPSGVKWTCLFFQNVSSTAEVPTRVFENIMLVQGSIAAEYDEFVGEKLASNTRKITAYEGLNNIWVDNGSFSIIGHGSKLDAMEDEITELDSRLNDCEKVTDVLGGVSSETFTNSVCRIAECKENEEIGISAGSGVSAVFHTNKNLFNLFNRTSGTVSGWSASSARTFDQEKYYNGFSGDGTYDGVNYGAIEYTTDGIITTAGSSGGGGGHGTLFPIKLPAGTYTISLDVYGSCRILFYNASNVYSSNVEAASSSTGESHKSFAFTVPANTSWVGLLFQNVKANSDPNTRTFKNIQIETGESESTYAACSFESVSVSATKIDAYEGTNCIWAYGGSLTVSRNAIIATLDDLKQWKDYMDGKTSVLNNDVIHRNLDVLPAVHACVSYGIHSTGQENNKRTIGILVTTDVHAREQVMQNAIDYFNEYPFLDIGMCLGDITGSYYNDSDGTWYTSIVNQATKPFYTLLGNHDSGNGTAAAQCSTVAQAFAKWIEPTLSTMGMPSLETPYYAIHDTTYGISIICLDTYDVPDTTDGSGNFVVSRGQNAYSQDQINWLISELANVPQYNHLILVQHDYSGTATKQDCIWSQAWGDYTDYSNYGEMIPDIINAWINKTTLSETYTTEVTGLPSITVSADFSSRTYSIFACHLVGHRHRDYWCKSAKYSNQNIVSLVCTADGLWQGENNDLPRVENTKSQDAFTIVSINKIHRTIKLARVGSNKTISMTDRTMYAIPY